MMTLAALFLSLASRFRNDASDEEEEEHSVPHSRLRNGGSIEFMSWFIVSVSGGGVSVAAGSEPGWEASMAGPASSAAISLSLLVFSTWCRPYICCYAGGRYDAENDDMYMRGAE
jgi:hypothetical protein